MNTLARQSISKTLVKACTAAVLLVTCLNSYAGNNEVEQMFAELGTEAITEIRAEINLENALLKGANILESTLETAVVIADKKAEYNASNNTLDNTTWISAVSTHPAIASIADMDITTTESKNIEVNMIALELAIELLENTTKRLEYRTLNTY